MPVSQPSKVQNATVSLQRSSPGLGCGRQSEGFFGPTFAALRQVARDRHGELFDSVQTTATVVAFAVDGASCAIVRDTVITIETTDSYEARALYSRAFPDLPQRVPEIGLGDARDRKVAPIRGNPPLMILYAMLTAPREHASCAGLTIPPNSTCSIDGEVVVRVMDSVRVLVATENHLFLFTSTEPLRDLASRTIQLGHVEYAEGALSVLGDGPTFALKVRTGSALPFGDRAALRFENGLGLAHYAPTPVPLDAINRLKVASCRDDDTPAGSCFEVEGKLIRFPR
jgi:hypothetical protein